MKNYINEITLVLISYKSKKKVIKFIKNISNNIKIIIIENSKDITIKDEIKNEKTELIIVNNIGYAASINHARKYIKTKYFIIFNPDVENVNNEVLEKFYYYAEKLENNFACLGPRYTNISSKTLKQSDKNKEIDVMSSISGACMFFNSEKFDLINGFDDNFFLYFEETDYCLRAKNMNLLSYQINLIKLKHEVGTSVEYKNDIEKNKIKELHIWHFIWSKFYFYKKEKGMIISLILFLPLIIRTIFKIYYNKILNNKINERKYQIRFEGLISSIKGENSHKRID